MIIYSRYSTSASLPSTDQVTIYQLQTGDWLQGSGQIQINFNQWNGPFTATPCAQPHTAEVFFAGNSWPRSQAYPGDQVVYDDGYARCLTAFRAYDGIDNPSSAFDVVAAVPGLVVTGGWCVSPPRPGRRTIRSETVVTNGGLCPLQAPGQRDDSSAEVQHAVSPDLAPLRP